MIRLEQVCKHYELGGETVEALQNVDLTVEDGEFLSVIGPSGSGKTTLMNILGCLDTPTSGRYFLAGKPVEHLQGREAARLRNRSIGFIFQNFNLIRAMSAVENVELPLTLRGVPRRERREIALQALDSVGLLSRKAHCPSELSGGQQQRVAIARVLASRPPLILADEPTGNLDRATGKEILRLLEDLHQAGSTIVMITHDDTIAASAPRMLCMRDGRLMKPLK